MRRRITLLLALAVTTTPAFAITNPASLFCEDMKGRVEITTLSDGSQIGLCHLPDEQLIEEWTLFRMYEGKVPGSSEPARKLQPKPGT